MYGQDPAKGSRRQIWVVGAMVIILLGLALAAALGAAPGARIASPALGAVAHATTPSPAAAIAAMASPSPRATDDPAAETPTAKVSATLTPFPTLTFTPAPTLTPTPRPTRTSTATATPPAQPTASPTAHPEPTNTPVIHEPPTGGDHFWLERPIAPGGTDTVARFYPYASRADGSYPIHHGVEFVNPMGTPILATAPGKVIVAGDDALVVYGARNDFYGLLVVQELEQRLNEQPVYVLYGHLSEIAVTVGQSLQTGDLVGKVGMSGVAEGPHLHLEVRVGQNDYGATVNPELWLKPKAGSGALAGLVVGPDGLPVPNELRVMLARASAPDAVVYTLVTYPTVGVNASPVWRENIALGGLAEGQWIARVIHGGRLYAQPVDIVEGKTSWFLMQLAQ